MRQRLNKRFTSLSYASFRELAQRTDLSPYERIGFPDAYREGYEDAIFRDILRKLPLLEQDNRTVLDIGPGCSGLPRMLIEHCQARGHKLVLVDSPEMLAHLPDSQGVVKVPGMFPTNSAEVLRQAGYVDVILSYSVLQYAFEDTSAWNFLDQALLLLARGGEMLIGDIPNVSKRKRFLASPSGREYHRAFTGEAADPVVEWNVVEPGLIDDSVVLALLARARAAGADAYVVPQAPGLPMANRREDILILKP